MRNWRTVSTTLAALALLAFMVATEKSALGYVMVTLAGLFFFLLFRAVWFGAPTAALMSLSLIGAIYTASRFKYWLTARRLHPHDVYLYGSWDTIVYMRDLYPQHYHLLYGGLALLVAILVMLIVVDGLRRPTLRIFVALTASHRIKDRVVHAARIPANITGRVLFPQMEL